MRLPKCIPLNDGARNARFFRVTFNYRPYRYWMKPANVQLNEIRLLASPMVNDVDTRNSTMEDSYSYKPFDPAYTSPGIDPVPGHRPDCGPRPRRNARLYFAARQMDDPAHRAHHHR